MQRVELELKVLGQALKNLRLRAGLTREEAFKLGSAAGAKCTVSSIYSWEASKRFPGADTLLRYVSGLGYDRHNLWAEVDQLAETETDLNPPSVSLKPLQQPRGQDGEPEWQSKIPEPIEVDEAIERLKSDPGLRSAFQRIWSLVEGEKEDSRSQESK